MPLINVSPKDMKEFVKQLKASGKHELTNYKDYTDMD